MLSCLSLGNCKKSSVLIFGGAIIALQSNWPCHSGIDNEMLLGPLARSWIVAVWSNICLQSNNEDVVFFFVQ